MRKTRTLVLSAMIAAVAVVILLIGGWIAIGTYAAPMLAGVAVLPLGRKAGAKWQTAVWITASVLAWMLVNDREEVLMYACLFGWYPIARPALQKLPKGPRIAVKAVSFNLILIAVEALVMLVIAPESESAGMMIALLAVFNLVFLLYDRILPRAEILIERRFSGLLKDF